MLVFTAVTSKNVERIATQTINRAEVECEQTKLNARPYLSNTVAIGVRTRIYFQPASLATCQYTVSERECGDFWFNYIK